MNFSYKFFEFGGLLWLAVPFLYAFGVAVRSAVSHSPSGVIQKDVQSIRSYFVATVCSIVHFFVVSFSLLRDWTWMLQVGEIERRWEDVDPFEVYNLQLITGRFGEVTDEMRSQFPIWVKLRPEPNITTTPMNYQELVSVWDGHSVLFGVDGLSLGLILLTAFITPLTLIYCWANVPHREAMCYYLLIIEVLLVVAFWVRDVMVFFILFELLLWPMFRLIVVWGAHEQKKKAAASFVLYTIFGSLILLIVILTLLTTYSTTMIDYIADWSLTEAWWTKLLWLPAFIAFAVKVPVWPFHHWLTLAHVEAPTNGSVILAALLLKLGSYGFLRYMLPVFKDQANFEFFMPIACCLCLMSVIFAAVMAISQSDLKRIVAYSSIAHMSFSLLGLLSVTSDRAVLGGTILFIAHGFVSAGLFFSVGFLYDRYHQRDVLYFRGLASLAPVWSLAFTLFNLANLGVPLSFNFLGEFLIFAELVNIYTYAVPLLILGLIVQVGYTMKLMSIMFGEVVGFVNSPRVLWADLSLHEIVIAVLLIVPTWYLGVHGQSVVELLTQMDSVLYRVDHAVELQAMLVGDLDVMPAWKWCSEWWCALEEYEMDRTLWAYGPDIYGQKEAFEALLEKYLSWTKGG
jgi:NADH-quinone oxidoreductase subunit M